MQSVLQNAGCSTDTFVDINADSSDADDNITAKAGVQRMIQVFCLLFLV